jgi:hypothetical protein
LSTCRVVVHQVPVVSGLVTAPGAQPAELAGVRRQHGRASITLPPAVHRGQRAERLGIEHDGGRRPLVGRRQQLAHQLRRREARPQPGPDDDRVVLVIEDARDRRLGVELLDVVLRQGHRGRLHDLRREQRLE